MLMSFDPLILLMEIYPNEMQVKLFSNKIFIIVSCMTAKPLEKYKCPR